MARIPYPDDAELSEETRRALASVPPLNVFRLLAAGQNALPNFLRLTGGLWNDAELPPRRRELAILQVARLTGAEYEWHQHVAVGRMVGVTGEELAAIEAGAVDGPPFGDDDRALLALVLGVIVDRGRADDELLAAARRSLSDRELIELHLLVGIYAGLAAMMTGLDLDLDEQLGVELLDSGPRGPRLGDGAEPTGRIRGPRGCLPVGREHGGRYTDPETTSEDEMTTNRSPPASPITGAPGIRGPAGAAVDGRSGPVGVAPERELERLGGEPVESELDQVAGRGTSSTLALAAGCGAPGNARVAR